jgi:HK97 family phage prohead protease/HK97 family phage major capsid protein
MSNFDFSGIATAYNVKCGDGRTILPGAFDHQHDQRVPIVWRHGHSDIRNIVGHGVLGKSEEPPGMRIYGTFNSTPEGQSAGKLVEAGDIEALSIYANELTETRTPAGLNTEHGIIREVSLVLTGQNPGAGIDEVVRHSEDPLEPGVVVLDGIIIHADFPIELFEEPEEEPEEEEEAEEEENLIQHADETISAVLGTLNEEQTNLFNVVLHSAAVGEKPTPSDESDGPSMKSVYDSLNEQQTTVLHYMAGELSSAELSQGDESPMTNHNIFEEGGNEEAVLSHEQINSVLDNARNQRAGSLRDMFRDAGLDVNQVSDTIQHSITDIDFMFPEARNVKPGGPQFYSRPMEWVEQVLRATKSRPFSRIKSQYADLTGADARAKGYVTGAQKVEEVIAVLKRVTTPQTIYKLQKLDRDDIIDITDFDVVTWLKGEMRMMLREELARAILISDGRANTGADAIQTANIRPIYNDNDVYTIKKPYNDVGNEQVLSAFTATETIALIDYIASARSEYRGSGSPTFYTQPEVLTQLLLVRDADGKRLHRSEQELANALRVRNIVEVPVMSGMSEAGVVDPSGLPTGTYTLATLGVIVNLADYVIGADKGGQTAFFDDFDIDYNKYTYLYETRLSGALINPKSAMTIQLVTAKTA